MKRKIVNFTWENEDAQKVFAEWLPFSDAQASAKDVDEIEKFVGLKSPLFVLDAGVPVDFRLQRASELPERNAFDFTLAYWHTIGFMSDGEIKKHFSIIHESLKPGSFFLYTFQGPQLAPSQELKTAIPIKSWTEKDGKFMLTEKSIQNSYRNEYCVVIDTNNGEIVDYKEHQRAISYEEVIEYLTSAGFLSVAGYKNFKGEPATPEEFNVFLCKKA